MARFSGNRFGTSYGRGEGPLARLALRRALLERLREGDRGRRVQAQALAGQGPGFTVQPTEMISGRQPTAGEATAFNERVRNRALYGRYGGSGIEREKIYGKTLAEVAKRQLSLKDRANILQRNRELEIMAANSFNPVPASSSYNTELKNILGGDPIGSPPARRQPSLRDTETPFTRKYGQGTPGGRITVPRGAPNAGVYEVPGEYDPEKRNLTRQENEGLSEIDWNPLARARERRAATPLRELARRIVAEIRAEDAASTEHGAPFVRMPMPPDPRKVSISDALESSRVRYR